MLNDEGQNVDLYIPRKCRSVTPCPGPATQRPRVPSPAPAGPPLLKVAVRDVGVQKVSQPSKRGAGKKGK